MAEDASAWEAFDALARGALREPAPHAWQEFERAWPALERWLALALRSLGVAPKIREDCGQEVLLRVWRGRADYRGSSPAELRAWLYQISRHEHARLLARQGRTPATEGYLSTDDEHPREPADPRLPKLSAALEQAEALAALEQCLAELPREDKGVIELLYSELAPSEREIAGIVGVSKSQVHVLRQRALKGLASCLRRKGVET